MVDIRLMAVSPAAMRNRKRLHSVQPFLRCVATFVLSG